MDRSLFEVLHCTMWKLSSIFPPSRIKSHRSPTADHEQGLRYSKNFANCSWQISNERGFLIQSDYTSSYHEAWPQLRDEENGMLPSIGRRLDIGKVKEVECSISFLLVPFMQITFPEQCRGKKETNFSLQKAGERRNCFAQNCNSLFNSREPTGMKPQAFKEITSIPTCHENLPW